MYICICKKCCLLLKEHSVIKNCFKQQPNQTYKLLKLKKIIQLLNSDCLFYGNHLNSKCFSCCFSVLAYIRFKLRNKTYCKYVLIILLLVVNSLNVVVLFYKLDFHLKILLFF